MFMVPWVDIPGKGGGVWAAALRGRKSAKRSGIKRGITGLLT
jgi:hypothetical protein